MGAQERLLRAVEYGEVTRIGSSKPVRVDVRIVGATNESLPAMVERGSFRADLLDRLSFEVVTLPPLRVREGDIEVLTDYFGRRMATELGWDGWPGFGSVAMRAMENYQWPGNVRELRNVVERAVYRWNDPTQPVDYVQFDPFESPWTAASVQPSTARDIVQGGTLADVDVNPANDDPGGNARHSTDFTAINQSMVKVGDFRATTEAFEKALLEQALAQHRYNQRQTAKALNLSYDQLRHSLKKHDLLG
jgi:psp operon transcriptional activator